MDTVLVSKDDLREMLRDVVAEELQAIRDKILHTPDETILSDIDAASRKGVSVATLRRMKYDGRVKTVQTSKGLMVRACDLS